MRAHEATLPVTDQLELPLAQTLSCGRAPTSDWRLDDHTRQVGREGVAAARALLAAGSRSGRRLGSDVTATDVGGRPDHADRAA